MDEKNIPTPSLREFSQELGAFIKDLISVMNRHEKVGASDKVSTFFGLCAMFVKHEDREAMEEGIAHLKTSLDETIEIIRWTSRQSEKDLEEIGKKQWSLNV